MATRNDVVELLIRLTKSGKLTWINDKREWSTNTLWDNDRRYLRIFSVKYSGPCKLNYSVNGDCPDNFVDNLNEDGDANDVLLGELRDLLMVMYPPLYHMTNYDAIQDAFDALTDLENEPESHLLV